MPPALDLNQLPPLPLILDQEKTPPSPGTLQPIPPLEDKELPKVIPPVEPSFTSKTESIRTTEKPPIRKVTSPFKVIPKPEMVEAPPSRSSAPSSVKMERPNPSSPGPPKKPRVSSSLTGPAITKQTTPPEVMLRNTVRRTLSEQGTGVSPFRDVSLLERLRWLALALFTSKTFNDISFEKTRRFRVDEVYLLRKETLTLISYASNDPIRHVYPRKIDYDLRRLRVEIQSAIIAETDFFKLPAGRNAVIRTGKHSHLIAIIRGDNNPVLETDLDYTHNRIENQVGKSLTDEVSNFTFPLQPMLEDCLLIQSPAGPE